MHRRLLITTLLGLCLSTSVTAASKYVSDELEITLRTGPSNEHKITRMLPSGTELRVMDTDNGYSFVHAPKYNKEGWVLTRFLSGTPIARDRLAKAEETIKTLKSNSSTAQTDLLALQEEHQVLQKKSTQLEQQNQQLSGELARIKKTAANALHLDSENQRLSNTLATLESSHNALQQQAKELKDQREKDWFIAGAGVLFAGMILGLIIPKLRPRKKDRWGSLD